MCSLPTSAISDGAYDGDMIVAELFLMFDPFKRQDPHPAVDLDAAFKLGIYNAETLRRYGETARTSFIIDGFIGERTVNLAVGNSGLGKTPLVLSMGISVAAGVPWLGRPVRQGRVLICDGESSYPEFYEIITNLSRNAGLDGIPPEFHVWSPMWAPYREMEDAFGPAHLEQIVATVRPDLIVLDPIRMFFPRAEGKSEETMGMFRVLRQMTRKYGCTWLLVHHRRKIDQKYQINLETNPLEWFQQSCGSLALVNHTDTRIGIDLPHEDEGKEADLVVAGFVRSHGRVGPLYLGRIYDEDGVPIAYRQLSGVDFLPSLYRVTYEKLPNLFRFNHVKSALGGKSDSNAAAFNKLTIALGLVRKLGHGQYEKIMENMEKPSLPSDSAA